MINVENLVQVKAFAQHDGARLSLLWIVSFACLVLAPQLPWGSVLALATPFFVGWRLVKFRNEVLDGAISLRRGYAFSVYTMLYGALLFALAQYLYFRFLDNGAFLSTIAETLKTLEATYQGSNAELQSMSQQIGALSATTPIQWALTFLVQNIMIAAIISLPIAAICARHTCNSNNIKQHTSLDK